MLYVILCRQLKQLVISIHTKVRKTLQPMAEFMDNGTRLISLMVLVIDWLLELRGA